MKKIVSLFIAILLAVSLAACAGTTATDTSGEPSASGSAPSGAAPSAAESADSDEPVHITFYTYNYMAQQKEGVDTLIAEFQEANPNITVEVVYASSTDINTKIPADLAAGVTPDLIQVVFDSLDYAVHNYGVQDLNTLVDPAELSEHLAGFEPAALEVAKVDGKLYGLPYTFSTPVLFYNVALFEQAGLDPDAPPQTWDEVAQYALQIKQNTDAEGFVFGGTTMGDWLLQGLIKSNGGSVMSDDKSAITFGEDPAIEAISMLQEMHENGAHADLTDFQAFEAFPQGQLGMLLSTSALQASMLKGAEAAGWEMRTAKMPSFGNKATVPCNSGSGLFICSTDPAKQQASWKFMKYLTSERGYTVITTMMGYPPLRPDIVNDEQYLKQWAEENPLVQPNLEQLKYVSPWQSYPGDNWFQIETILLDAFNKCLFSDADVAQTMTDAQTQAQSLMP